MDFILQFDNGGGLTMQLGQSYVHHYDNMKQAAEDLSAYLGFSFVNEEWIDEWEGNEIDQIGLLEYDSERERNGGTRTLENEIPSKGSSSRNERDFAVAYEKLLRGLK